MPLQLHRVPPSLSPSASFNDLTHCICESYAVPRNRLWRLFRHDPTPAGFIELRDRLMREYRADADATRACWLTIVDTDIGDKVVGAALWHTYLENPYPSQTCISRKEKKVLEKVSPLFIHADMEVEKSAVA
ncbi:MAG: hypothetical protein LQ349_008093 [Xanthoria aureola]|nr:MAG: hypothetical protein LQ349_008093 [Xanthoria aureola]